MVAKTEYGDLYGCRLGREGLTSADKQGRNYPNAALL
jgi:hypothetical protein